MHMHQFYLLVFSDSALFSSVLAFFICVLAFHFLSLFFSFSFLLLQTVTAGHAHTVDSFFHKLLKLEAGGRGTHASIRFDSKCFMSWGATMTRQTKKLAQKVLRRLSLDERSHAVLCRDINPSHLSRLLRSRGISPLWFGLATSLRDELLYVSSHDTALRPCRRGLADVHICLPGQLLSIGAGNHSATCKSPGQFG